VAVVVVVVVVEQVDTAQEHNHLLLEVPTP
jgi:hypothetical protein